MLRTSFFILFLFTAILIYGQSTIMSCRGVKVQPGETLYALCRIHGISIAELLRCNPEMDKNTKLKEGQLVLIPVNAGEHAENAPLSISQDEDYDDLEWINGEYWKVTRHPVKPKETFYSLSRFYNLSLEKLKALNPGIAQPQVGGSIAVGKMKLSLPKGETKEQEKEFQEPTSEIKVKPDFTAPTLPPAASPILSPPAPVNPSDYMEAFKQWGKDGLKPSRMRGKCTSDNQELSLHEAACDIAPIGSLVQVRNMLTQQSIIVKVKSTLTPEEKKRGILVCVHQNILQKISSSKESLLLVETMIYRSQ